MLMLCAGAQAVTKKRGTYDTNGGPIVITHAFDYTAVKRYTINTSNVNIRKSTHTRTSTPMHTPVRFEGLVRRYHTLDR